VAPAHAPHPEYVLRLVRVGHELTNGVAEPQEVGKPKIWSVPLIATADTSRSRSGEIRRTPSTSPKSAAVF